MPFAAGIKFTKEAFSKYFNPGDLKLAVDDFVVVEDKDTGGERIGFVSCLEGRAPVQMPHLPRIVRTAGEDEVERWYDEKIKERDGIQLARERAAFHGLPIKVSTLSYFSARQQVLIYFTSEQRVDFREMVRDLAGYFKARIEMWQIGARKEAGIMDGLGVCGNRLCCSAWMKDFPTVAIRHAKEQDIIQPPSKLSGPCNRLRCCLRYEHESYVALATGAPSTGCKGCSSGGACGVVIDRNLLKQTVTVRMETGGAPQTMPFEDFKMTEDAPAAPSEKPRRGGPGPRRKRDDDDDDRYERN